MGKKNAEVLLVLSGRLYFDSVDAYVALMKNKNRYLRYDISFKHILL